MAGGDLARCPEPLSGSPPNHAWNSSMLLVGPNPHVLKDEDMLLKDELPIIKSWSKSTSKGHTSTRRIDLAGENLID